MCHLEEYIFRQLLQLTCSTINMKIDTAITKTYRHDNRISFHQ